MHIALLTLMGRGDVLSQYNVFGYTLVCKNKSCRDYEEKITIAIFKKISPPITTKQTCSKKRKTVPVKTFSCGIPSGSYSLSKHLHHSYSLHLQSTVRQIVFISLYWWYSLVPLVWTEFSYSA